MAPRYKADDENDSLPEPRQAGEPYSAVSPLHRQARPRARVVSRLSESDDEPLTPPQVHPSRSRLPDDEPRPMSRHVSDVAESRSYEEWEPTPPEEEESVFGSPLPERRYTRHSDENNPLSDFRRPPTKGMTVWKALLKVILLPFTLTYFFTRALPKIVRIIISLSFCGVVLLVIVAVIYGIKAERYDITQIMRMPERTIVLDRKGNEIGTLHGENRRSIENLDAEVPQHFIDALIMQEDRSFWTHGGIDLRGLVRAVVQVFKHGRTTQGASTLTMQLAKNTYNHQRRTMGAKLTEMALARRIEATYDKKTILTCYINRVFWGHTFLGLKQAAKGYFNKQPRDLTIAESAMLAGIVCSPNEFSPYRSPSSAKIQRDKVLKLMHDHGYITRNQYHSALAQPIVTNKPEPRGTDNYALDLIRSEVDHILDMLDNQQRHVKEDAMYSGGFVVQTTLDVDLQDDVMREIDTRLVEMLEKGKRYPHQTRAQYQALLAAMPPEQAEKARPAYIQAACVVIDNATGALLAVVGGRDSRESPLNRAVQSRRQIGSLFKPIVYATYFEHGGGPKSLISDDRIRPGEIPGARNWSPGNSDGRFTGAHPAEWGLLKSRNTMSVRVGARAGLDNVINTALMAGFPRTARKPGPTIYLGTWEASPLEVASAYTIFANGGVRPTPFIIQSITDSTGHVLWRNTSTARRVLSQRSTVAISSILQQITKPGGTAGSMQRLGFLSPCGGKTGTTNAYKNAWFCGFTSELTAAVWVGFDRPVTIADKAYGGTVALPLWVGAMQRAAARGYPMREIRTAPAEARRQALRLCRETGQVAHAGCEYQGCAYTETMADFTKSRELCSMHAQVSSAAEPFADDEAAEDPDIFPDEDIAEEAD